jgi:hypothetical protein
MCYCAGDQKGLNEVVGGSLELVHSGWDLTQLI